MHCTATPLDHSNTRSLKDQRGPQRLKGQNVHTFVDVPCRSMETGDYDSWVRCLERTSLTRDASEGTPVNPMKYHGRVYTKVVIIESSI